MKILLATPVYPPEIGGPATYTVELSERLKDEHEITIVAFGDNAEEMEGTHLVAVSKKKPLPVRLAEYTWKLFKAAKDVDIIYVQNAMASGLPAYIVSTLRNTPYVVKFVGDEAWERAQHHDLTDKRLSEFLQNPETNLRGKIMLKIQKLVLAGAGRITPPSRFLQEVLMDGYGLDESQFRVNYNASKKAAEVEDVETFFPEERKSHQICTSARLVPWKNVDGIIDAVGILKEEYPDVHLVIAGDGPELENLKTYTKEKELEDYITFLGRVSRTQTRQMRNESEVFVLNSIYEGLPHTILSSFSAGIPVVATEIPGTNEVAIDGETALTVEPENPNDLARAISQLFDNESLQKELVTNGKEFLKTQFSWGTHIKTLLEVFESLINKPRG